MVAAGVQTSGMAEIRGIDIDKLAKGFADEESVFKRFVTVTPTSAREIRWYKKTAGFLSGSKTSGMTSDFTENTDQLALPTVVEQSWTRTSSYVRKYFVASPMLSTEDIMDSDIDILATNVRDLTREIEHRVDTRIWNVITENQTASTINEVAITNEWDDYANATPIADLMQAKAYIRAYGYNPEGAVLALNSNEHMYLVNWLIATKGSSIPAFASERIKDGVVMEILGLRVIVSENVTPDYGAIWIPMAATWKTFIPITARTIEEVGIGTTIRIWEEGECILQNPRAVCLLSNVGPS